MNEGRAYMTNGLIARPEHMALTSRTHTHSGQDLQPAAMCIRERSRENSCAACDFGFCPELVFYQILVMCALRFVITSFSARLVQGAGPKPSGKERRKEQHLHLLSLAADLFSVHWCSNQPVAWPIRLEGQKSLSFIMENTDALKNVQFQMNGNEGWSY